ncbi:MAG TPA: hypothetical protein VKA09_16360 [Nitrososphaeraceae archaeon]|nr:hypothetical protein [Nitrososphaeraceae archaeon]HKI09965.1 hypothetical protein [Nitrososphaeraceae archaeon]
MHCNTYTDLAIAEDNDSALAGSTDFIAGVPTGMDHIFSQISLAIGLFF